MIDHDIPQADLVLGFQPPMVRPDTGFAVSALWLRNLNGRG